MSDFARRLTDTLEKETPDQGDRATKANQHKSNIRSRVAREELPARRGVAIVWPAGDDKGLKAKRRAMRDEWMDNAHGQVADDIMALRLLWPIFNAVYVDSSGYAILSNEQLATVVKRSVSVVQRGLRTLAEAGWIILIEEKSRDTDGNPHSKRKILLSFPEGFFTDDRFGEEPATANEKTAEEWQAEADASFDSVHPVHSDVSMADAGDASRNAGDAQQNAGDAPASARHDRHSPCTTPDDNPLSKTPEKEKEEFSLEMEDYWAIETAAKKADRISDLMESKNISREYAEGILVKQVVIEALFGDRFYYDDPEREYKNMAPARRKLWRAQALRELRELDSVVSEYGAWSTTGEDL